MSTEIKWTLGLLDREASTRERCSGGGPCDRGESQGYLTDVMARIADHPINKIDALLLSLALDTIVQARLAPKAGAARPS